MDQITNFWINLTDAQATLIAAGGTLLSAFIVAILTPILLKNSVKGIEDAAKLAKDNAEKIGLSFGELNDQFSAFEKNLAGLQNRINDFVAESAEQPDAVSTSSKDSQARQELRNTWFELRDLLESDASDLRLNGHTRGKYGRIDRRDPPALFNAMQADGNLRGQREDWDKAQDIYFTFRSKSSPVPTANDLAQLIALKNKLKSTPFEPRKSTRRSLSGISTDATPNAEA